MKVLQHFSYGIIHVLNHKKESPYQIAKQQKHKKMILHLLNARKTFHRSVFFLQPPIHRLHDEYSADSITPVTQNFLGLTQL